MIIDAHTHMGLNTYAGEVTGREGLSSATRYVQILEDNGVDKGFTFSSSAFRQDPQRANDALAWARDTYPDVILPWGTVDPYWNEGKLRREMRRCIEELDFVGFKFVPWIQGFSMMVAGTDVIAEECVDMDVPVVFHDGSPLYCTALQIVYYARAYPQLRVLSGHGGLREGWRDTIQAAKELDNYWICLSGPTQQGIQTVYDEVGPDKLLFGSDGGSLHPAVTTNYLRRIRALDAPAEDIEKILGLNALRFLKMEA